MPRSAAYVPQTTGLARPMSFVRSPAAKKIEPAIIAATGMFDCSRKENCSRRAHTWKTAALVVAGTVSNLEPNLTGNSRVAVEQLEKEQLPFGGCPSRSATETLAQFGELRLPPLEHV